MPETILPMIPDVPADATPRQRPFLSSLKEIVEVREGRRGDPQEILVTIRRLLEVLAGDELIGATELRLRPKESSGGPEGTVFYCKTDNSIWVATE